MIEVVEPTLVSEAGHCAALFLSLQGAAPDLPFRLWVDRRAQLPGWDERRVPLRPLFHRRLRKLEAILLYRRLLRADTPVLVPTASYFDLRALDLAARQQIPALRAFLYFHKLRASAARARALQAMAQRQPNLELFGTSEEIVQRLRTAGFANVRRVLPVLAAGQTVAAPTSFRYLLCAGAARADKGFGKIVDLVQELAATGSTLPIAVQTSGDHYGRYDERTAADLMRLRSTSYAHLRLVADTLDAEHYAALFPGAICLQAYDPAEYADKMSAVIFDALRAGAPVVTLAGTSMAAIVQETGAGLVIDSPTPQALRNAAQEIIDDYAQFQRRAIAAAARYRPDASWAPLVERLRAALANPSV